jgi:hypothetical protein
VGLGTTTAAKFVLGIEIGSALNLTRRILDSVVYRIYLTRRRLPQRRQIIPSALKTEVALPTDSLDLLAAFRAFRYRRRRLLLLEHRNYEQLPITWFTLDFRADVIPDGIDDILGVEV